jgi:uncharacterized peroxidase-related enzyme
MQAHDNLYKSVLHCSDNTLPKEFLETVAVYTSLLNGCDYAVTHHFTNMKRLINNDSKSRTILNALKSGHPEELFLGKQLELLRYTEKLTCHPDLIAESDIISLRDTGAVDGEILEVNQVCALFNYANRLINGLGIKLGEDVIGYYADH